MKPTQLEFAFMQRSAEPLSLSLENFDQGFTQSEITTWDDCSEKWFLGYNQLLQKKNSFEWYFVYGDAVHRTLSNWYSTGSEEIATLQLPDVLTTDEEYEAEKFKKILKVQCEAYFRYYADDIQKWDIFLNEEEVCIEFEGVKLRGKIDLGFTIGDSAPVYVDHKTASTISGYTTAGWQFRFQFMFYLWLVSKAKGVNANTQFMVNAMKKPALRQGKAETVDTFVARVQQDMAQRPDEYFYREIIRDLPKLMSDFEDRILRPKLERIKFIQQQQHLTSTPQDAILVSAMTRNLNTNKCHQFGSTCSFLPICSNGYQAEQHGYARRNNKHQELE